MARTYTDEQRAEAKRLYVELGLAEAARRCDVPKGTISTWARRDGLKTQVVENTREARAASAELRNARREQLKDKILDKILDMLERMDKPHIDFRGKDNAKVEFDIATSGDVRNYAVTLGILVDKYRDLSGESAGDSGGMTTDQARAILAGLLGVPADKVVDELAELRKKRVA